MKKYAILLALSLLFASCGKEKVVDGSLLQKRREVVYEVNQNKPFTGIGVKESWGKIIKTKYKKGIIEEEIQFYAENGQVYSVTQYKNGLKDGEEIGYHPNGERWLVTPYEKGIKNGIEKRYSNSGVMEEKNIYEEGKLLEKTIHDSYRRQTIITLMREKIRFTQRGNEEELDQIVLGYDFNGNINSITAGHTGHYLRKDYLGYAFVDGSWEAFLKYGEPDVFYPKDLEKAIISIDPKIINVESTEKIIESLKKITESEFWENW